jgi:hypothetical protein
MKAVKAVKAVKGPMLVSMLLVHPWRINATCKQDSVPSIMPRQNRPAVITDDS